MKLKLKLFIYFLLCGAAFAAVTTQVSGVTPTSGNIQITLTAPTGSACLVEVSLDPTTYSPIDDNNAALFTNANLTSRGLGSRIISQKTQNYLAGASGAAQQGLDGKWYGRGLTASTPYYGRVNHDGACDSGSEVFFSFVTANIPSGTTHNKEMPSDGAGGAAWCRFYGTSSASCSDGQTGLQLFPLNVPGDAQAQQPVTNGVFLSAFDTTSTWLHLGTYNGSGTFTTPATFTGTGETPAYFPIAINLGWQASYEPINGANSLDYLEVDITGLGAGATSSARQATGCFSLAGGGPRCDTPVQTVTLPSSSGPVHFGGTTFGMTDWGASFSGLDPVLAEQHKGTATYPGSGSVFTWASGNVFRPQSWIAGTQITFTGDCTGTYALAGVPTGTQTTLTVVGTPTCTGTAPSWVVTPLTFVLAKATASTDLITISQVNIQYQIDIGQQLGLAPCRMGTLVAALLQYRPRLEAT